MTFENGSVAALFLTQASQYADRPFLHVPSETAKIYNSTVTDYSYAEAQQVMLTLVDQYESLGCGPGVRVGIAMENRPEFFLHFLALNYLGTSIVPLNVGMQDKELNYLVTHSEVPLIVVHPQFIEQFSRISESVTQQPQVVAANAVHEASDVVGASHAEITSNTEAAIIYTSGTTGTPKGCILSNAYFRYLGEFYVGLGDMCAFKPGEDRLITPLPVSHMNALATSFMGVLESGSCLIQLDRFHPRSWWQTVRESKATIMHYLGVMPAMLLNAEEVPEDDFSGQVRFGFGAGCDPRHHANFEKRFGIPLTEAWAMSETGAGAWISVSKEPRMVGQRCFGQCPDGLEYKLIDEQGKEVAQGETGELLVRRRGDKPRQYFFSGYLKDEQATDEVWAGGWFHTGDEVKVDENGYFYFVDRRKNIIRRSGENIACIEVESILFRHKDVVNCAVAPVPDEIRGEEVMALVIAAKSADQQQLAQELFDLCLDHLVYYKAPGYVGFVDQIPLTASEKVQRGEVKKITKTMVASGECLDLCKQKRPANKSGSGEH